MDRNCERKGKVAAGFLYLVYGEGEREEEDGCLGLLLSKNGDWTVTVIQRDRKMKIFRVEKCQNSEEKCLRWISGIDWKIRGKKWRPWARECEPRGRILVNFWVSFSGPCATLCREKKWKKDLLFDFRYSLNLFNFCLLYSMFYGCDLRISWMSKEKDAVSWLEIGLSNTSSVVSYVLSTLVPGL